MAFSVNDVYLVGHLGRDVQVRRTSTGTAVATLSLATSYKYQEKEKTTWHQVQVWGKTAEACGQYLSKGSRVYVKGRIDTAEDWTDQKGEKHRGEKIVVAESVGFLDSNNNKIERQREPGSDDIPNRW